MPDLAKGCVVGGRYTIDSERPIAEGTYAQVYRATDSTNGGKRVAVKVEAASQGGARSLLRAEANVLRFLQRQPGVPRFIDFREKDEVAKSGFVVMELLGEDLGVTLSRARQLSSHAVAFLGLQMLRSIQAVHAKGIVHRDIKPNNFMLGRGSKGMNVYLIDFGLGRRHLDRSGMPREPRQGCAFRGTTRYASISAQQGRDQARADDLWSLGFVLLELCAGHLPWNFYKSQAQAGLGPAAKAQAKQRVLEEKLKVVSMARRADRKPSGFLRSAPAPIVEFLRAVDKLSYADVPDYDFLVSRLRSIGTEEARKQAAKRELLPSDTICGFSLRDVMRLPGRPDAAQAAQKSSAKKRRRLPTEEATTADTRDSKKSPTDRSTGSNSWATAASERWWQMQVDRIASAEPLLKRAEALVAAHRETLGEE